jgi:metallo-beta-lactamase family protein
MIITFHGAARTVTGSKHLLQLESGIRILLDCGFFQGHGKVTDEMNRHLGFNPADVDFLILSHAHIDHSGSIPFLVKQGFRGRIFSTPATLDLCRIMLADTAHIQENDIFYLNKRRSERNQPLLKPLYDLKDVQKALDLFVPVKWNEPYRLCDEAEFTFKNAGHITGASGVYLNITESAKSFSLFFTGDIGREQDSILNAPEPFPQADYIICESTYGDRLHDTPAKAEEELQKLVLETCFTNRGKLIVPAFSIGRTQEIVYALNNLWNSRQLPSSIPIYVDSPLSINATDIMRRHPESFNEETIRSLNSDPDPFGFSTLKYVQKVEESIALNTNHTPMVIISASGMAEAGRVKHHIKNSIENSHNTILIAGYCTPDSLGGRIARGSKTVRIFGKEYEVKAGVYVIDSYSAHADYNEMLTYLSCQNPSLVKKVFLVHGEYETQIAWRERLLHHGFKNIEIPDMRSSWEI